MSSVNLDQLHRSTLGVYESLLDQFNPGLQRLVALGKTYIQAFQALSSTSEEYFHALGKMGEQALHTLSSRSLGDVIIQIAESQRRLTNELDGMFRWFHSEVLREMENNVKLDKDFIAGSRRRYEMEVHNHASALDRQQRRGHQDVVEYTHFLRDSQKDALKEEERRYRFLAEKHCNLSLTIAQLMNKMGGALHQRAQEWGDCVNETRASRPRTPSRMEQMGMREEERGQQWTKREEPSLGRIPSRGPSPVPMRSRSGSLGDGLGGGRLMRAVVSCAPSPNPTLLDFSMGDAITVLVPEPRNGWLYGKGQNSPRQGWFPASYVEPLDQAPRPSTPSAGMRTSHSMSNLFDQSGGGGQGGPPPPAPPLPSAANQIPRSQSRHNTPSLERRAEHQQKPRSEDYGIKPALFPRGTNPFATVKLKPTVTNDRSGPRAPGRII
ncbi:brain-specific angiogenesis inhibitor 1-associated protein 2-like protein 2 [Alosa sapidissima]|uniref:brain-specific angiogenesis inhibitor 1-associated protein 2-like protein 2 n=1 Tax=Alosa sapidissima TaxID=34773 RepID=UPI001C09E542|nr:brain-specific angiogenesis inhibitor 1-associated protein 2-like protein 2 [Alosa sapidissima]